MANIVINVEANGNTESFRTQAGITVGQLVDAEFRSDFNVSDRAEVLLDGRAVSSDTVLRSGDEISFRVAASSKS